LRFRVPFDTLDLSTVDDFARWSRVWMPTSATSAGAAVVLDLRDVELVMAAGVSALLELEAELARRGLALRLVEATPIVGRVFDICDVSQRWVGAGDEVSP
jgi:anti-anti-sigma factor